MDAKVFKNAINDILGKMDFKKTKTFWIRSGKEVSEKNVFQKSLYGNRYYFRTYYVINNLPLAKGFDGHVHLNPNLSDEEFNTLSVLCDLEYQIDNRERISKLEKLLSNALMNTQMDNLESLQKYARCLDMPILGIVQDYFAASI